MRVATWNLENLFAPGTNDAAPTTDRVYLAKLVALASTVRALEADVVAVQEVGPPPALDDLVSAVGGIWHTEVAAPDGRGIRVGLMSRHPLHGVEQVTTFPPGLAPVQVGDDGRTLDRLGRPALKATVSVGGREVHVVSVHLKSKLLTFPGGRFAPDDEDERARYAVYALHRRATEAAGVRAHVTDLLASVRGDESVPDRYSRIYRGRRELIDHLMVSDPLVRTVTEVGAGPGVVPSITDDPRGRRNEPGSDHRPVHATFSDQRRREASYGVVASSVSPARAGSDRSGGR